VSEDQRKNKNERYKTKLIKCLKQYITVENVKKYPCRRIPWIIYLLVIASFAFGFSMEPSSAVFSTLMNFTATALGFFGMFAIYLYTSYDTRIRTLKVEHERYKIEAIYATFTDKRKFTALAEKYKHNIKELSRRRGTTSIRIMVALACLMLSLLASSMFVGYTYFITSPSSRIYFELTFLSKQLLLSSILCFLSIGLLMIVWLIYTISKKYASRTNDNTDN
jgi:hypothetical protein